MRLKRKSPHLPWFGPYSGGLLAAALMMLVVWPVGAVASDAQDEPDNGDAVPETADGDSLPVVGAVDAARPGTGVSLSASRQFRVSGGDPADRQRMLILADEVLEGYRKLMGRGIPASFAIQMVLHDPREVSPAGPPVRAGLEVVDETDYRGRIDIRLDSGLVANEVREAVSSLILAADMTRERPADELRADGILVPPWLSEGVAEALHFKRDPATSAVALAVVGRERALPVEDLIPADPATMSGAMRAAFRASACGLVLTLLDQPGGSEQFGRLLMDLASLESDPLVLIRHHFQDLAGSERGVEKWWALQMASLAAPSALNFLSMEQSDRALARALIAEYVLEAGARPRRATLAEAIAMEDGGERQAALASVRLGLRRLAPTLHPMFRSLADAHLLLIGRVLENGLDRAEAALVLDSLDSERAGVYKRLDGIDDYLNWVEVSTQDGATAPVRRPARGADTEVPPREGDPVGDYLDQVEALLD